MKHRHVVFNHRGLSHYDACSMVEHDAAAEARRRMHVHTETRADLALEKRGKGTTVITPQPVRNPLRLQRMKSLEEQECGDQVVAGRIA